MAEVSVNVNGEPTTAQVDPRTLLSDFLRDNLGLTGTHVGCEHGYCGACTVLLDGASTRSCLMLAIQADGRSVETVESLSSNGAGLHPIQQAFKDCHGLQCGFCTPWAAHERRGTCLHEPRQRSRRDPRTSLGQRVRCTGYHHIVDAVERALNGAREQADDS